MTSGIKLFWINKIVFFCFSRNHCLKGRDQDCWVHFRSCCWNDLMWSWILLGFCFFFFFFLIKTKGYPEFLPTDVFSKQTDRLRWKATEWYEAPFWGKEISSSREGQRGLEVACWHILHLDACTVFLQNDGWCVSNNHHWTLSSILSQERRSGEDSLEVALEVNLYLQIRCHGEFVNSTIEGFR